uniref:Disease resistance RPP13-like protein 4 n=1 Tax=Aegilops tauschii TaxID=37682 RepID=M8B3M9_AEGTA
MAMVLDAFASYIADTIKQMAADEVGMLLGVTGEIDSLHDKLESLRDYLADAERKRITDRTVQGWVTSSRASCTTRPTSLTSASSRPWVGGMQHPHPAATRCSSACGIPCSQMILAGASGSSTRGWATSASAVAASGKLNKRLDDICKLGAAFSFIKLETYQDCRPGRPSAADRKTDPVLERSAVVGEKIEEDTRALVKELTKDNDGIVVLAIVGVGGIGKTTLAKKVFNHEEIQHKFEKKMWLSVTQDFSEVELLRLAITTADGKLPATEDKSMLVPALLNAVRNQKFLLVLDDMWSDRAWTSLLNRSFSYGAPGSRIVIPTRNDTVARGTRAREPYHRIDKLQPRQRRQKRA